jgi:hypothetical protein
MGRLLRFYTVVPSDGEKASIRGAVMSKSLLSFITAAAFFVATLTPSLAQEITQPSVQPIPILAGQSGGAGTSGGSDSGGATAPAPPPAAAEPVQPLPPAQPAGPQQAAFFANPAAIGGAALVTAIVVCAFVCFSHSSSTTTSTTVQH